MREIKFRAWDKRLKCFTDRFVLAPTSPTWAAFPIEQADSISKYQELVRDHLGVVNSDEKLAIMCFCTSDYTLTDWANVYGIEYYIIEQWTGLKDKNGKEDYHKDICTYTDDAGDRQTGTIEWESGAWWLIAIGGDDEGNQNVMLAHADDHVNIGNIHENPELLSGTDQGMNQEVISD